MARNSPAPSVGSRFSPSFCTALFIAEIREESNAGAAGLLSAGKIAGRVEDSNLATAIELLREPHKQNPAMVAEMDRLLDNYNYADTARILNEKGFRTVTAYQ